MLNIKVFEGRFREILDRLDELAGETGDADLEEMNAEFEDALFLLEQIDPKDEDAGEEFMDALDEFEALARDYARLKGAGEAAGRIAMLVEMARNNL